MPYSNTLNEYVTRKVIPPLISSLHLSRHDLRYLSISLLVISAILPHYVFADNGDQLDTMQIPGKLIADTSGIIQVFPKNSLSSLDNLVATSSDPSTLQVLGVEKDSSHNSYAVKVNALNPGKVTVSIAAPGFTPMELPLEIYQDSKAATSLLIKATPKTFSTSGPDVGYISIETVNSDGVPTPVSSDTSLKLSVSDSSIASLAQEQLVIKQGSYFATEKFDMLKPGTVTIYASAPSMQPVSDTVTMNNDAVPYTLQVYAYPPLVNVDNDAISYVVVQLHDSAGNPVIAKEDIPVSVRIVNPEDTSSVNTSGQSPFVQINNALVIKSGSYWGYIPVEFTAGENATYNVDISAKGYVISTTPISTTVTTSITSTTGTTVPGSTTSATGTTTTTTTTTASGSTSTTSTTSSSGTTTNGQTTTTGTATASSKSASVCSLNPIPTSTSQVQFATVAKGFVMDDKTPCFYPLPILTTGKEELVGVMALKDSSGFPALAKSNLSFKIDSSDVSTVSVPSVDMEYGSQSGLVFAQVGNAANTVVLNVPSDSPQQVTPIVTSPTLTTSGLVAEPLLQTVLPNTPFPLAVYTTSNGALSSFKSDFTALISPQESISPIQLTVQHDNPIFLSDETLLKGGPQKISITTPDYSSNFNVVGASTKPSSVMLGYPDKMVSNSNMLFSLELLDENQLPIATENDMNIKLVSSDPSVLSVPDNVQVAKGSYYATFDAHSSEGGTAEIAVLADGVPLSKFDVTTTSYTPVLSIDSQDHADNGVPVTAAVTATYDKAPVSGLSVDWTVTGAVIKNKDYATDQNGKATISIVTDDPNTVKIQASVGGGAYQTVTATKQISINPPLASGPSGQSGQGANPTGGFTIMGVSPILFVIPGAAAAAFVVLKKKNMLEGITEKINIADRFPRIRKET